ncbi:MAG: alpha/beta fold hydrolase [Rhodovulum sp.]|nr:alpha/beta fold hydrolase [Rhodovulum sp.]
MIEIETRGSHLAGDDRTGISGATPATGTAVPPAPLLRHLVVEPGVAGAEPSAVPTPAGPALAAAVAASPDNRAAHVIEVRAAAASGPPVVLLHGLGGLAEEILAPLMPLAARHRLLALDRPGYGSSAPQPADELAPDRQADWVAAVLESLDVGPAIVVAHSFGASVALWLARSHPQRVAGLVLLAPFCRPTQPASKPLLRLATMPAIGRPVRWAIPQVAPWLAGRVLASSFAPDPVPPHMLRLPFAVAVQPPAVLAMAAELRGFNPAMERFAAPARPIDCRTVVIWGGRDRVTPWPHHGAWLMPQLGWGSAVELPAVGHMIQHLRPDVVAGAVAEVAASCGRLGRLMHRVRRAAGRAVRSTSRHIRSQARTGSTCQMRSQ